jgi:hypothetical protein
LKREACDTPALLQHQQERCCSAALSLLLLVNFIHLFTFILLGEGGRLGVGKDYENGGGFFADSYGTLLSGYGGTAAFLA